MKILNKWWFWFGFSFFIYANTLNHSYTVDDLIVVTKNKMTQKGVSEIPEIFKHSYLYGYDGREDESYRPVTLATFAIEKTFFDAKPAASHFVQVLLYAICILVLFKFLQNLFGEKKQNLVYAITLLFLIHPIHTEVVANVKSRDELLSALFLFSSLLYFSKWVNQNKTSQMLLSILLFFAATLSKETAVLGVLLFPACYFYMKESTLLQVVKNTSVFILPFMLYFGIRTLVLSDVLIQDPIDPVANSLAMAANSGEVFTTNLSIFAKYMQLVVAPINLSWDYSIATIPLVSFGSISTIFGLLSLLTILGFFVFGILKRNLIGFGALVFLSTFALTSNFFFLINCNLGERFLFIPVLGLIIILVVVSDYFLKDATKIKFVVLGVFSVFFIGRTVTRNADWKDNLSIYKSGVIVSPNSVKAHFNLATEFLEQGNKASNIALKSEWFNQSISEFNIAKTKYPGYVNIYENMGFVFAEMGKIQSDSIEKIRYYEEGLEILNTAIDSLNLTKPSLFQNKFFLLEELIRLERDSSNKQALMVEMVQTIDLKKEKTSDEVQRELYYLRILKEDDKLQVVAKDLLDLDTEKGGYILELSKLYFGENKFDQSLKLMKLYIQYYPNDLSSKSNYGMLLEISGKKKEALQIYEEILAVDPNQVHTKTLYDKLKPNK